MKNGYWHRLLRIDLTNLTIDVEEIELNDLQRFIGGAGLGGEILRREVSADQDPYAPENRLIFATGPFQGTAVPGGAKFSVVSVSPVTKTFGDAAAGAAWGTTFKDAGYDVLVVQGAAETPVYISIDDDSVEIKDATDLWGLDSFDVIDAVRAKLENEKYSVASIGPAGERGVATSCVVFDKHSFAGRCGMGAVMGSKNLKAIAVRGTQKVPLHDPEKAATLLKKYRSHISKTVVENEFRKHGTPGLCEDAEGFGDMPIKYWEGDVWPEGAKRLGGESYTTLLDAKPLPCRYCPIGCHRRVTFKHIDGEMRTSVGPEYETLGMMGTNLMIDDPRVVAIANEIANRMGIDTISTGAMVGFAMECYEKGWVTIDDTNGLDLTWGNPEALIQLTEQIGAREGFGEIFAEGTLPAAKRISKEAEESVVHVKGLDLPAHDPRACISLAPSYVTSTRGACHFRGPCEDVEMGGFEIPEVGVTDDTTKFFDAENQAFLAAKCQDLGSLANSLVLCLFMVDGGDWAMTDVAEMFNAITGWDYSVEDLLKAGERGFVSQRLINNRDGYNVETDTLPKKMFKAAKEGARAGQVPPLESMLQDYYRIRGWNDKGEPTESTLQGLGLEQ
jgi:aldehyde:ferredoxin oxidoreductase